MSEEVISTEVNLSNENVETDIMSAFDVPEVKGDTPTTNEEVLDANGNPTENNFPYEIDDRFKDLPKEEAALRTLKSKYDKLYSLNEKNAIEQETLAKKTEFLDMLLEDDEVLETFISERKPELIKRKDISSQIQEKISEEFPDYKPSREEADENPGGKAWLYFKRLDELYNESKGNLSKNKTVKELLEERKLKVKEESLETEKRLTEVKKTMNWDDETVKSFVKWGQSLSPLALAKMYRFALKTSRIPNVNNIPGSPSSGLRDQFLKNF